LLILKPNTSSHLNHQKRRNILIQQRCNILGGEMMQNSILTHLVKRHSQFPTVCIYCNSQIPADSLHYVEEGVTGHIHSLIARKYCEACYTKHGEQTLLHDKPR